MNSAERSDVNDNEILLFIGNVESNLGMRNFFTVFVKNDENSETCSVGKFENIAEIYFAYGIFIFVNKVQSVGTHEKIGRRTSSPDSACTLVTFADVLAEMRWQR